MNVQIDSAKAIEWSRKVNLEVAKTKQTLKEVREVCVLPDEEDSILKMVRATGELLETAYDTTTTAFQNAWQDIENGLADFFRVGDRISDGFEELGRLIKHR